MRKNLLIALAILFTSLCSVAQTTHPISTAYLSPNSVEAHAELMFAEPVMEQITVVIKDLTGKTMLTLNQQIPDEECTQIPLNLETLRKGIYICQITGASGKVKTLKFQKT